MANPDDDWRTRSIRAFTDHVSLINALYKAGLSSLGELWDYWQAGKSLLTAGGFGGALNAVAVNSFLDYCRLHHEIPRLLELTRIETAPSSPQPPSPPAKQEGKKSAMTTTEKSAQKTPAEKTKTTPEVPEKIRKLLTQYEQVLGEVSHFVELIVRQELEIAEKQTVVNATKERHDSAKNDLADAKEARDGTKHALFMFLKPGPAKILPLFDRMEPASEEKHGAHSDEWRKQPISAMRLSLVATTLLTAADIVFVGQLQDRVQADPENWWEPIEGLTQPMGAAIGDRLNDFITEHTGK